MARGDSIDTDTFMYNPALYPIVMSEFDMDEFEEELDEIIRPVMPDDWVPLSETGEFEF